MTTSRLSNALLTTIVTVAIASGWIVTRAQSADEDRIVTTQHQIQLSGRSLGYTARAGYLPIIDNETGEPLARMFFMAYTLERAANDPARPLTFLWNGGPGSSSSLVHLLGFGPRRFGPNGVPIDNDGTWLDFSDLVFVDPVGTGYSRPVNAEFGREFYQTRGDAESVAEFIRVYRNRFDAHDAPLFLAGESYGVTRAAGVADILERRGIRLSGTILIGLALPLGHMSADQRVALNVPTYTATAFTHKKLARDLPRDLQPTLRQSEAWSIKRYAPALARRDAMSDSERRQVITELARFTGFDTSVIDQKALAIPMPQFSEQLLRSENLIVGRYDSRMTAPFDPEQQKMYDPTKDPSLRNILDNVSVVRYLRSELKFESDLNYQGPFGGGYPPATTFRGDWMSMRWNRDTKASNDANGARPAATSAAENAEADQPLRRAMQVNRSLRVLSSCGYYDLVCSYFVNERLAAELDTDVRSRVLVRNYAGGHAVYTDDAVRRQMKEDVGQFVRADAPEPQPRLGATGEASSATEAMRAADAVTHDQIAIAGRTLRYRARAGTLPIRVDETGETHAYVFYVAYTLEGAASEQRERPLTFLWNGGPGANSVLLHLTGFGPKRIRTGHDSPSASCECELADNEATWLEHSDLVFVDPVGTGFSRPVRAEYGGEFYNTLGDITSIAEFIRVYMTRFDAWDAPLFLAGESYGAWRASGVAEALEQRGRRVAGVMLISGGIQLGPVIDDEMRTALFIPTRTAAAFHHRQLAANLQKDLQATLHEVEDWARLEYGPALKRLAALTEAERESIVTKLARYTGLDGGLIDKSTLVVGRQQFAEQLLAGEKRVLARFDTREVEGPPRATSRAATVVRYLHSVLRFKTDIAYQGAEEGFMPPSRGRVLSIGARWNYNQGPPSAPSATPASRPPNLDAPPGGPQPWLRRAIAINPALHVFVAAGLYDSLNSCAANTYLASQLEPELRDNVTAMCYPGGHMMYDDPAVRKQVTSDIAAFVSTAVSARASR